MLAKPVLYVKLAGYVVFVLWSELQRAFTKTLTRRRAHWFEPSPTSSRTRNIVIVGASFAGNHVAQLLTSSLPPNSPFRIIVIEPNSHFQFTWVLPRLCVIKGHEHKAFIPYRGNVLDKPEGVLTWIQDRVSSITKHDVRLEGSGKEVPYEFLVIATGSGVEHGLPSRVNAADKLEGMQLMQAMQNRIESGKSIIVVGGGAAGVEVATDTKSLYPDKKVTLIHSRKTVMHRFGKELQKSALEGLHRLGVEVILGDRVVEERTRSGAIVLESGRELQCDFTINCTGQRPSSELLKNLSPDVISSDGHIRVKPTLQVAHPQLSNVYACGDVADTSTPNPNARSAMRQAAVVADNILLVARGKNPRNEYKNYWADGVIKLTLGLDRSVTHLGDGMSELLFKSKETDEALMSAMCWSRMGQRPFDDPYMEERKVEVGSSVSTR